MRLQCIGCGKAFPLDEIRYTCDCGNLLSVERDAITVSRDVFDGRRASRNPIDQSGVWRFREAVLDAGDAMQAAFGDIASIAIISPIARQGVRRV